MNEQGYLIGWVESIKSPPNAGAHEAKVKLLHLVAPFLQPHEPIGAGKEQADSWI